MHFSRKLYTRHQISSLSVLCFYWKINFPPSCVVVYCQRQRACCNCVHEPLGESLSVSSSGDAGFTRSAIIGKPEKKAKGVRGRGIDTASHIFSCERLDIRKEISGLPREPPHAESTVPLNYGHVWERLVWDSTEANENRSKQRGGEPRRENTPKQRSATPPPVPLFVIRLQSLFKKGVFGAFFFFAAN